MKFINKYKKYICNRKLIPYIIVLTILLLSVGYSAFSSNLSIRDLYAEVRLEKDIRITGVSVAPETGTTFNPYDYGTEYQIDPGDGITRTFYVLEDGDSTTLTKVTSGAYITENSNAGTTGPGEVTLILDDYIANDVEWNEFNPLEKPFVGNESGPQNAISYLKEQTKNWINVEVNLPTYNQIYAVNNSNDISSTPWLKCSRDYWTSSAYSGDEFSAWIIEWDLLFYDAINTTHVIRPVITINKSELEIDQGIQNNGGTTTYIDYNVSNIQAGINLPNASSSVTFNVVVTNIGSTEIGIKEITGLPDNLDYQILNYSLKDKICNEDNICKLGIQKEIQVQIKYKEGYYDSSNTLYNVVANFNFQPFYSVTYTDIEGSEYPTEILGGGTLTVDFGDNAPDNIKVKMNNVETTNYTYENGVLALPNVSGNVEIIKFIPPPSFADDDWSTIIANVQSGNLSAYKEGDTKEIALTGFTNGEEGSNGLYTIRIANTSTPAECSTSGFSQTACGFVIEFEDIITTAKMNSEITNVGGWEASEMRTYVNSTIYESLPEELRNSIIDTTVVSGHGSTSGENNFTTIDKLYLLSTAEVWEQGTSNQIDYDAARDVTRQLDYYKNYENEDGSIGVTTNNYSGAIKKYNVITSNWWLRSAVSNDSDYFYSVTMDGDWNYDIATSTNGVAVAFRIG